MRVRFTQLGLRERKREKDEDVTEKIFKASKAKLGTEWDNKNSSNKKKKDDDSDDDDVDDEYEDYESEEDDKIEERQQELNAIFLRTQKEEEEGVAEVYPNLKRV
jgi:hypothetical protein